MNSTNFATNVLQAGHDVTKQATNLFGSSKAVKKVTDETKLFSPLANIEDTKWLIVHSVCMKHRQLSDAQQVVTRVTKDLKANLKV